MNYATFTKFTGINNNVAKGYNVIDGALKKVDAENFYQGNFETISALPEELEDIIKSLKQGQFITAGVHKTLTIGKCQMDASRTANAFVFPEGPGLLILDGDSLQDPAFNISTVEGYLNKIASLDVELFPQLWFVPQVLHQEYHFLEKALVCADYTVLLLLMMASKFLTFLIFSTNDQY